MRAISGSDPQMKAQGLFRNIMVERLGDSLKGQKAAKLLLHDFPVGCRRLTPGPGFLESITQENVELRWDDIEKITEKGIQTRSGQEIEYDVIVCAMGFDTSFCPSYPLIGRRGVNPAIKWTNKLPGAYFGLTSPDMPPDMPNYVSFIGPNSTISSGSLATAIYIYKWFQKLQTEDIQSFEVRHDANKEYNEHMHTYLKRTVWTEGCRSWYKRGTIDGPVVAVYGGNTFQFMEAIKNARWEDFNIEKTFKANRFSYLGNGFTKRKTYGGTIGTTQTLDFEEYWRSFVLPEIHE
ncbi:uncharacterized protein N7483_000028 [Penicillium malachiteum]|uniref:uncharacterized protein n=1 Tax=Penicillium malachiteum TaxID=1324776 RepID=UPI0025489C67|nr:uncharacterized protein N7483_000028 [Penicillium malachiteum]KAJ5734903.1 hypothetical protein N7483_000028 [Penicillium malachiteum]